MLEMLIPEPIIRYVRRQHRNYVLRKSLRDFAALTPSELPSDALCRNLIYGWGNERFSAGDEYIKALTEQARKSNASILECGSGLSTLLLGIIAQKLENKVWTLEHHPEWAERIASSLKKFKLESIELCIAPLRNYEDFDWYDAPLERLPKDFSLVVCDGPPGFTRGGRYGLIPVMREFLASGCIVLVDDAARRGEQEILQDWSHELSATVEIFGTKKPFAIMIIP